MVQPPDSLDRGTFIQAVDHVIRERKTAKILSDIQACTDTLDFHERATINAKIREAIELAGWAPFHKMADSSHLQAESNSPVPWRFYVLEKTLCCQILDFIKHQTTTTRDPKWPRTMQKKIPKLLAGADALVIVTWLPDPSPTDQPELTINNIEHIAASSAAIQNLILAAEARGLYTYWSSGGVLRDDEIFAYLGIPRNQQLLGAIFLASVEHTTNAPAAGGNRDKRGRDWVRWLNPSDFA